MLKSRRFALIGIALLIVAAVALTGCGGRPSTNDPIKSGAQAMRSQLAELQKALEAGDQAKAKTGAEKLEEAWAKFEDGVKAKDKALYGQIEDPLHAIEAGVKVSPLDAKTLGEQVKVLDGLLAGLVK